MACAKNFQQYDYGPTTNKEMYGTEQPPEYTVSEIGVPFLIIYSDHDAVFDHKVTEMMKVKCSENNVNFVVGCFCSSQ